VAGRVSRPALLFAATGALYLLGGAVAVTRVAVAPAATAAPLLPVLPARLPNEAGRILILEYHRIGGAEDRWTRSLENFRADLDRLYRE